MRNESHTSKSMNNRFTRVVFCIRILFLLKSIRIRVINNEYNVKKYLNTNLFSRFIIH